MSDTNCRLAVIGAGVMGEAAIHGLLNKKFTIPTCIVASDPLETRLEELARTYGIRIGNDNLAAIRDADVVLLSVKPQMLDKLLTNLSGAIPARALVLSIVAGASVEKLTKGLAHPAVVRAMPNTPAQIGEGITVWTTSAGVDQHQRALASEILAALGQQVFVEEESYLDMATALSGTGPGYVFLFMEALIDAGVHMGFPRRISEQLVTQTMLGSVEYFKKNALHPAQLRNQVTSPGGTTAEALYYLEKAGFRTAISRAVWAAYERSRELGKGMTAHPPSDAKKEEA